jgi:threonine dehydratase
MKLAIPANIFVSPISLPANVQRIGYYRAELVVTGVRYDDALIARSVDASGNSL